MHIGTQAALQVQAMTITGVRDQLAEIQASPVPASAPVAAHADVILTLSTAAARLVSGA